MFVSCQKNENANPSESIDGWINSNEKFDNQIVIIANGLAQNPDNPTVTISANVKNQSPNARLAVNSMNIPKDTQNGLMYKSFLPSDKETSNSAKAIFGKNLDLTFLNSNNKASRLSSTSEDSPYIPQVIKLDVSSEIIGEKLDLNKNLKVKWNSDSKNKNPVYVTLTAQISPKSEIITIKHEKKSDDGEMVIPQSKLSVIPKDAIVNIAVGRASEKVVKLDGVDTKITALTYSALTRIKAIK